MLNRVTERIPATLDDDNRPMATQTSHLVQRYRATLPEKHAQIDNAWRMACTNPDDTAAVPYLQIALHRVTGSAGLYGFQAISDAARDAVQRLDVASTAAGNAGDLELRQAIEKLLVQMRAAF